MMNELDNHNLTSDNIIAFQGIPGAYSEMAFKEKFRTICRFK